jgi:hypothetical protein
MLMGVLTRNDDVFVLSMPDLVATPFVTINSLANSGAASTVPVLVEFDYLPADAVSRAIVDAAWNPVSQARRDRGDLVDITVTVNGRGHRRIGDIFVVRFPVAADEIFDPDFAMIVAASVKLPASAGIRGIELGLRSHRGLEFLLPFRPAPVAHFATGWRFAATPESVAVELRFHLDEKGGPVCFRIGRVFAGLHYDPYVFNPAYELVSHSRGRPHFDGADAVKAAFVTDAREASRKHHYVGMQSFIHPFLVERLGTPALKMLIGTPNSISWYGLDPQHRIEEFADYG